MIPIISDLNPFADEPDSLFAIVNPLLERIASLCSATRITDDLGEIHIDDHLYGCKQCDVNEIYILLSLLDGGFALIYPYLHALLTASGSEGEWMETDGEFAEKDPMRAPIRFSVQKHTCSHGDTVFPLLYLVAECRHPEFDPEAARRQVALLVEHLSIPANIHELAEAIVRELF
jgi:hypothetical protein